MACDQDPQRALMEGRISGASVCFFLALLLHAGATGPGTNQMASEAPPRRRAARAVWGACGWCKAGAGAATGAEMAGRKGGWAKNPQATQLLQQASGRVPLRNEKDSPLLAPAG